MRAKYLMFLITLLQEAHALTVRMTNAGIRFPYLAFLLSGGHTLIIIVHGVNHYTQLASTLDESIGQTYDKVARELGIRWNPAPKSGYISRSRPGSGGGPGPALERIALNGNDNKYKLTIPLNRFEKRLNTNFSFSGLRTQVTQLATKLLANSSPGDREEIVADLAASFQFTAVAHLCLKLKMAFDRCRQIGVYPSALVASGGVASNFTIRKRLEETAALHGVPLECPPSELCTDNGAMIAWAGWERFRLGLVDPTTIDIISDWPLETLKGMYPQKK
ncbi:Mitochondrial tRNAs modification protein, variant 2 [Entomophthora muscae]|uniref:Mitochondrial tRNAs modification protein, variant 2 n=1 Tax=Entomophthora muscae TaxID=34485 RepID=A0ACC2RUI5_9FUNG|nr:Mitochondrial tRNAs modification protein, variant 2 [Entomophthora muscae]